MPFDYYHRLGRRRQLAYRRSDALSEVRLPRSSELLPLVARLCQALEIEKRPQLQDVCQRLADAITEQLAMPATDIRVLEKRPSKSWGELHGLYEPSENGESARITVWMRTAQRRQVVAFRTFLRTVLHELCHHLDYELFELEESFHTEGFFKRESSLFHQLVD